MQEEMKGRLKNSEERKKETIEKTGKISGIKEGKERWLEKEMERKERK